MANVVTEAAKPAMASTDAGTVKAVSISEKIDAERFEAERTTKGTSTSVWAGARMNRAVPPSTIGKVVTE